MKDRLAPRLGASYDLLGDGKVRLFGSGADTSTGQS
jgi:hypothetical protein